MVGYLFAGVLLGFLLGCSNLYLALKLGFTVGVAILSVFSWAGLLWFIGLFAKSKPRFSPADYACFQSLASAMSYGAGTVIATALAARVMMAEPGPGVWVYTLWVVAMCGLGTCLALPLRAGLLKTLPFPSGKAAAELVHSVEDPGQMKPFLATLGMTGVWVWLKDSLGWIPATLGFGAKLQWSLSPLLIGLGALLGVRTCLSLWLGAVVFFIVFPSMQTQSQELDQGLWFAISMMLCAGLVDFPWKSLRGKTGQRLSLGGVPIKKFATWLSVFGLLCLLTSAVGLRIPWHFSILGLLLSFIFAVLACRVTGETDVVPTGSLGKLSLLTFGLVPGGSASTQMAATGILAGSSAAAADFMTDLRCGKDLNCPADRQFNYQLGGAIIGPLLFVPAFFAISNQGQLLGSEGLPAPAAQIWLSVAEILNGDLWQQSTFAQTVLGGASAGILTGFWAKLSPRWSLSPVPFATAVVLDLTTTLTLLSGALLALALKEKSKQAIWCAMIAAESAVMVILFLMA